MSFFGFKFNTCMALAIVATVVVALAACGSSSDATLDAEAILAAQTPCSMSAHSASSMGALEKSCGVTSPSGNVIPGWACPHSEPSNTGYSLVFIGCNASFQTVNYDKSECIRDNATDLIWEGEGDGVSGKHKTNFTNEGLQRFVSYEIIDGVPYVNKYVPATTKMINSIGNTVGYRDAVNAKGLCGASDWRIPTARELLSLRQSQELPSLHPYLDVRSSDINQRIYWTSNQIVGAAPMAAAFNVDYIFDLSSYESEILPKFLMSNNRKYRSDLASVRLVRAGKPVPALFRFDGLHN